MRNSEFPLLLIFCLLFPVQTNAQEDYPVVPDDVEVSLFARDPLVRNPCAITFDAKGRLCVGMGPQYRSPKPDTPPDSVWIVTDEDGDGSAETRKEFATGFNAIQGLAWKGGDLWVANAPDLTIVRDNDGDDVADEYVRVYTDLGNLEHGLHGLNFGPDGKLYMSKGNSKGLSILPNRIAPKAFRELWGIAGVPPETPGPKPVFFNKSNYQKNYHDPKDDWGVTGGILCCDDEGENLEIISRGFRNPWDIAFDDTFSWLGTDNDQTMGEKIFAPFFGAHFGWGHAWSYDWKGDDHLPTAPSSGPLFEGSGAGVIYCNVPGYPEKYRDVFLINDWLNRDVLIYRSQWDGAWRKPASQTLDKFAHAGSGRSMPLSKGRAFDPVDIEVGPDGAIWISSWGRQYGAYYVDGKLANEGRIYRLWPKDFSPAKLKERDKPINKFSIEELIDDLGSHLPVWRTNAREELIRRGKTAKPKLLEVIWNYNSSIALQTWAIWTLSEIDREGEFWYARNRNQLIQSTRIAAFRPELDLRVYGSSLLNAHPRVRLEAVIAIRRYGKQEWPDYLLELISRENDRIVYYAAWGALMDLLSVEDRKALLKDDNPRIRLAAFLGLLEEDILTDQQVASFTEDSALADIAKKRLGGKHKFEQRGRPLTSTGGLPTLTAMVIPFSEVSASSRRTYTASILQPGARYYTDRDYHITAVPPELQGETFLQTACSDADETSGITVNLQLKYPSTVFLIDDARAENLPTWAREKWQPTDLTIKGTDPRKMRVYRADFPAGPLTLGTSRDGISARKGNYIVAVRPRLLKPDGSIATQQSTVPLLGKADVDRGRDLFFSKHGANCASCHQLKGRGNNHAPDLSDIGSRADAGVLIKSIVNPNADIVEGFAAKAISTKSGDAYSGIVLSETGRAVTMALMGGVKVEIPRRDIASREGLPVSAMPAGFGAMLTSQQLADLTAFLLAQKKPEPIAKKDGVFEFRQEGNELNLYLGQKRFATYLVKHEVLTRRGFINIVTPSGIPVTRKFPPRNPGDQDHREMHPGLWMSFGWLEGNDYWRLKSKVIHEGFFEVPIGKRGEASFKSRDRYLGSDGKETICMQDTRYHFRHIEEGILLEWDAEFYNNDRDFRFGDQEEGGLGLRIASPLRVQGGNGRIINDRGETNGKGTWGKPFKWIDYAGTVDGKVVGIMVIPHAENKRACWAHSRDYGVLVSNPFPRQPKERRAPYVTTTVKKGERFRLRYHVLIHDSEKFDPGQVYQKIQAEK